MLKIYIDADGCPVIDQTIAIADSFGIACCIVCDHAHMFYIDDVEIIMVDQGNDHADYKILELLKANDVVVTQDYGLAAMALAKKAHPISQNGICYTNDNIEGMLAQRHMSAKLRKQTHHYTHIAKRTYEQDQAYEKALYRLLESLK